MKLRDAAFSRVSLKLKKARRANNSDTEAISIYFSEASQLYKTGSLNEQDESDFLKILDELSKNPTKSLLKIIAKPRKGRPPLSDSEIRRDKTLAGYAYSFNQIDNKAYPLSSTTRKRTNAFLAASDEYNDAYKPEKPVTQEDAARAYERHSKWAKEWHMKFTGGSSSTF